MRFGANAPRVTILRRAIAPDNSDGVARGDFEIAFHTWASYRPIQAIEMTEAGFAQDEQGLEINIHDTRRNRTITHADRLILSVVLDHADLEGRLSYDIRTVSPPDRATGSIRLTAVRRGS